MTTYIILAVLWGIFCAYWQFKIDGYCGKRWWSVVVFLVNAIAFLGSVCVAVAIAYRHTTKKKSRGKFD